jgi:outer membrane immunogenic protein
MKNPAIAIAAIALIGTPAFAADMAVKAPPPAPAPVPTWTGFYGGIQFGGAWNNETVSSSPNDPVAAALLSGAFGISGQQPVVTSFRLNQSGWAGGADAGYNWQVTNWLVGIETDFSGTSLSGQASGTSILQGPPAEVFTQSINAQTSTDWYGTVRGRLGWLATPSLLLFGTGGFAYGRVGDSANYTFNGAAGPHLFGADPSFSFFCSSNNPCFAGSSSSIRTGWIAGGGLEWLLDPHWSFKVGYQFVDLATDTVRVSAVSVNAVPAGTVPSSFNAVFHDSFNVVRVGLNYQFH